MPELMSTTACFLLHTLRFFLLTRCILKHPTLLRLESFQHQASSSWLYRSLATSYHQPNHTGYAVELPNEVLSNIISNLGDDFVRLRTCGLELPKWLWSILTNFELYQALKRREITNTIRPPLTAFDDSPAGRLDLKRREQEWIQHTKGMPVKQRIRRQLRIPVDYHYQIEGQYSVTISKNVSTLECFAVVMDLPTQRRIRIPAVGKITVAPVLSNTLVAFADETCLYTCQLKDLDFDDDNFDLDLPQVIQASGIVMMTAKHNQVAVGFEAKGSAVKIYDFTTHTFIRTQLVPGSIYSLFWGDDLYVASLSGGTDVTLKIESLRGDSVEAATFPYRVDEVSRITTQSTGDAWQITLHFLYSQQQVLLLNGLRVIRTIVGRPGGPIWRGMMYAPHYSAPHEYAMYNGVGIQIERVESREIVGKLRTEMPISRQCLVINDTFLLAVGIGKSVILESRNIVIMTFDDSIIFPQPVDETSAISGYQWISDTKRWPWIVSPHGAFSPV